MQCVTVRRVDCEALYIMIIDIFITVGTGRIGAIAWVPYRTTKNKACLDIQ
jgi:hypothetical protein